MQAILYKIFRLHDPSEFVITWTLTSPPQNWILHQEKAKKNKENFLFYQKIQFYGDEGWEIDILHTYQIMKLADITPILTTYIAEFRPPWQTHKGRFKKIRKSRKRKRSHRIPDSKLTPETTKNKYNLSPKFQNQDIIQISPRLPKIIRNRVWESIFGEKFYGHCYSCNKPLKVNEGWHCGYPIAEAKGGKTEENNLYPLCSLCNRSHNSNNF